MVIEVMIEVVVEVHSLEHYLDDGIREVVELFGIQGMGWACIRILGWASQGSIEEKVFRMKEG